MGTPQTLKQTEGHWRRDARGGARPSALRQHWVPASRGQGFGLQRALIHSAHQPKPETSSNNESTTGLSRPLNELDRQRSIVLSEESTRVSHMNTLKFMLFC